jgi:hypothetical protein
MIRTVSLWIRSNGKFSKPSYQDNKQTRLKAQDGEYYLRCAGRWYPVGNDPLLALDAKRPRKNCCGRWSAEPCQNPKPCPI